MYTTSFTNPILDCSSTMLRQWIKLVISVDYHPCDPGSTRWFHEGTEYRKADLQAGKALRYEDPGGLFGRITLREMADEGVTVEYGAHQYILDMSRQVARLDEGGRDYTEFELWLVLVPAIVVEDTPGFYRQFHTKEQLAGLEDPDIGQLQESGEPCAKYALGRWHYLMAPEPDSVRQAEALLREAADAGVPDAFSALSTMYSYGDTLEDRMDMDEMARLRDEALSRGSELAAFKYARTRVSGVLASPVEPDTVRGEIERRLEADPDASPEWYSVLGYAYEELGQDRKAQDIYEEGARRGCIRCFADLAQMASRLGDRNQAGEWLEKGMEAGSGLCYVLGTPMDKAEFEALEPAARRSRSSLMEERLLRGLDLGEGLCAYYLGLYAYFGWFDFPVDEEKAKDYLQHGVALGDGECCQFLADILEEESTDPGQRKEAAKLRLRAVRYGCDDEQIRGLLTRDYREGLLDEYKDEIERYWLSEDEEEPEEDDGRWDAYV